MRSSLPLGNKGNESLHSSPTKHLKFDNPQSFANEILKGVTTAVITNQDPEFLFQITEQNGELAEASKEVILQGIEKIRNTLRVHEDQF